MLYASIELTMIRKAFKMKVYPDRIAEYTARHNPIWPELQEVLQARGVLTYSIFYDADNHTLFAYAEIESEERWQSIAQTDVCRRWWDHMAELMETHADNSPVSTELKEVFHLS